MTPYLQLMKVLLPLVSVVVWDVINDRVDELTIKLAQGQKHDKPAFLAGLILLLAVAAYFAPFRLRL